MYNVGEAIEGLFYAFVIAVVATIILVLYVLWQTFFSLDTWSVCAKLETDAAKVQCMKAFYE